MQKTTNEKQTKTKRSKRNRSFSERVRAKWFWCAFKLGFQLICIASLIFKLNLELALSIMLKQRELYESIFIQTTLSFVLSRKIINIYNDIAQKYGNVTGKDFRKYEKIEHKKNKLKLNTDFLNNCKQLDVYPKFLIFKLPNVSNKDALSIRKRLLRSTINKRNKELQHLSKELSLSENLLSIQLSTIDFYILTKSITSSNKKSLQKSLYTQQKSYFHWRGIETYLHAQLTKLLLISQNMN